MSRLWVSLLIVVSSLLSFNVMGESTKIKKNELQTITGQIQKIQSTLNQDQQQQTDLQQKLKATEIALAEFPKEISRINQLQQREQDALTQLKKEAKDVQIKLAKQNDALSLQVKCAYQLGKINELKILLNQENPNTLSRHLGYYRYLTQKRVELIAVIKQTLLSLTNTMREISDHQQTLENVLLEKQQQQAKQESIQKERQQLILRLNQDVQSKQQQLATLIANQQAIKEAIDQLQTQVISIPNKPFSLLRGRLQWPAKGTIAANFGTPLDVGDQRLSGVIIKAPYGTAVRAISSGKIIFANWLRGFGLLVIINHGNGYMSLYARNQNLRVNVGDQVKAGDVISNIGSTGGYSTSSLYFEIRQNGIPINPSLWCRYT